MKKTSLICFVLLIILISAKCAKETKSSKNISNQIFVNQSLVNQPTNWGKLKCGLYINKNAEIGFEDYKSSEKSAIIEKYYITHFGFNDFKEKSLKQVIDTATFRKLGNTYYKDKNHIYHFYGMAGGGQFYVFDKADYDTFEVLSDCYTKDKNNIYEARSGKLDSVDYQTFKTKKDLSACVAKDKYGYIIWNERATKDHLEDEYTQKAIKELDK